MHRDCPHFGKFSALRTANVISVEWNTEEEQQIDRDYVSMIVEYNSALSAYEGENEPLAQAKEALGAESLTVEDYPNRNTRR